MAVDSLVYGLLIFDFCSVNGVAHSTSIPIGHVFGRNMSSLISIEECKFRDRFIEELNEAMDIERLRDLISQFSQR